MRDRLYFHVVWATRGRDPTIDAGVAEFLGRYLPSVARQERSRIVELGMVTTHVHLLIKTHPTTSLPRLIQRFKGGSSVLVNREGHSRQGKPVRWAKGYNVETVSPRSVGAARAYVRGQGQHHPSERIAGWPPEAAGSLELRDPEKSLSATD